MGLTKDLSARMVDITRVKHGQIAEMARKKPEPSPEFRKAIARAVDRRR